MGPLIQSRIERYAASEIRFNLMAVAGDRAAALTKRLAAAARRRDAAAAKLTGAPPPPAAAAAVVGGDGDVGMAEAAGGSSGAEGEAEAGGQLPSDEAALQQLVAELEGEIDRWGGWLRE